MAIFITPVSQITTARVDYVIKVRVVRAYKVPFNGNQNDIMSMELVVHDMAGRKIHMSIPKAYVSSIGSQLKEGHIYKLRNFFVKDNEMRYKTTDHLFRLSLYHKTEIKEVKGVGFPSVMFNLKSFGVISQIEELNTTPLFDIIGVIKEIGNISNEKNSKLVEILIEDEIHRTVFCTLWEDLVDEFIQKWDKKGKKIPIILVQFCRPTLYKGGIRAGTTYNCSRFFLNENMKEINDFRTRIFGDESFIHDLPISIEVKKPKVEEDFGEIAANIKPLTEIFLQETGEFWICARIECVLVNGGWYYMSCKKCTKKVVMVNHKFYCDRCLKYENSANQRFMLRMEVYDGSCTGQLLVWDKEAVQLTGKKAGEIDIVNHEAGASVPFEIQEMLVGKTALFKVKVRKDPKAIKGSAYNCSRVCLDPKMVQKFSTKCLETVEHVSLSDIEEENEFIETCMNLAEITEMGTDLGSSQNVSKLSDSSFLTPKAVDLASSGDTEWMNSVCISAKRKLEEDFNLCETEEKKKGRKMVKEEKEA